MIYLHCIKFVLKFSSNVFRIFLFHILYLLINKVSTFRIIPNVIFKVFTATSADCSKINFHSRIIYYKKINLPDIHQLIEGV